MSACSVRRSLRRSRDRRHDRAIGVQQRVEEARLADVRRADDRDLRRPREAAGRVRRCASSASIGAITPAIALARLLRRDEVIALVREIERRLELRDDVEEIVFDRRDRRRQCALELIERRARLQRRDGVDQIRDRLGLDEIELLIEERAQRELARLGEPRPGADRRAQDRVRTTGLPCAEISTTCSPVYECGDSNNVTTT